MLVSKQVSIDEDTSRSCCCWSLDDGKVLFTWPREQRIEGREHGEHVASMRSRGGRYSVTHTDCHSINYKPSLDPLSRRRMVTKLEKNVFGVEDDENKVKVEGKCDVRISCRLSVSRSLATLAS